MPLWNIFSKEELEKQLRAKGHEYTLVSFYQYAKIEDPQAFRNALFSSWTQLDILGRTYIAKEGINAQIAVPTPNFEAFQEQLYAVPFLNGIRLNVAVDSKVTEFPFLKLKIKVRDKILADGLNDETFDVTNKGKHLNAQEFNALTDKSDCLLVDFRNHYEHEVGHFKDAILPDVDTFRDSLPLIEEDILRETKTKTSSCIVPEAFDAKKHLHGSNTGDSTMSINWMEGSSSTPTSAKNRALKTNSSVRILSLMSDERSG